MRPYMSCHNGVTIRNKEYKIDKILYHGIKKRIEFRFNEEK